MPATIQGIERARIARTDDQEAARAPQSDDAHSRTQNRDTAGRVQDALAPVFVCNAMKLATTILSLLRADYGSSAIELLHDLEWLRGLRGETVAAVEAALADLVASGLAVEAEDGFRRVVEVEQLLF